MASPRVINPTVQVPGTRQERVTRSPSFPFGLRWKPWQLQPCGLIPVLPGETLTSMMLQMQFWTDPLVATLKNSPWTFEYFCFYTKFRDLPGWESSADGLGRDLIQMIESGEDLSANQDADGNTVTYCPPGGIDYLTAAIQRISEVYFREAGQAHSVAALDGLPLAHAFAGGRRDVMDRLTTASAEDRRAAMPAYVGGLVAEAYQNYAAQRNDAAGDLLSMDYEDIIRAAGGKAVVRDVDREDLHIPELIAYSRHFDYGNNTVEPTTGVPAVAFGHRLKQQMRKAYRFPEFGWLVPVVLARPKVFWKNQQGSFATMMQTRASWFMPEDDNDSDAHWLTIDDAVGPLKALMDTPNTDYTIDLRSLLWDGEQFLNYAPSATYDAVVTLPEADCDRDYPTSTDVMAVFTDTTNGRITANGVIDCSIKTYPQVNPRQTQDDRVFSNRD